MQTDKNFIRRDDLILEIDNSSQESKGTYNVVFDVEDFEDSKPIYDQLNSITQVDTNEDQLIGLVNILDKYEANENFKKIYLYEDKDISNHYVKLLAFYFNHFLRLGSMGIDYSYVESKLMFVLQQRMTVLKDKRKDEALYTICEYISTKPIKFHNFIKIFSWIIH